MNFGNIYETMKQIKMNVLLFLENSNVLMGLTVFSRIKDFGTMLDYDSFY